MSAVEAAVAVMALTAPLGAAVMDGAKVWRFSVRKVGGIRFFALGRLRLSFCIAREG